MACPPHNGQFLACRVNHGITRTPGLRAAVDRTPGWRAHAFRRRPGAAPAGCNEHEPVIGPQVEAALRGEVRRFEVPAKVNGRQEWVQQRIIPDVDADGRIVG